MAEYRSQSHAQSHLRDQADALANQAPVVTRLLVVDDDPIQRRVIAKLAGQAGHEVAVAASVAEATQQLGASPFDCVTVDLGLQDGNGADVLYLIADKSPGAQVLFITGESGAPLQATQRVARENALHVHDVFSKPLDLVGLRASLVRARELLWVKKGHTA
jgi:two-component system chemotaxis response regulator CheY